MSLPERCVDLTEDHIDDGLKSVVRMRALLDHLARIAKPKEGAAKILVAISRIATTSCEWLEGTLHVEVDDILGATEIAVMSDLGGGMRELIFPRLLLTVDYEEMVNAVKVAPKLIIPLKYRVRGDRMILKRDVPGTVAPPSFEIAEESLRRSLPPKLRRSLAPISTRSKDESIEGAILARVFPKTVRTLVIDDLAAVDVGWDFGAYSSTVNTRETKPPPPPKTPSKIPTRPPPVIDEPPISEAPRSRKPRTSKAPPKPVPTVQRPSKLPPKPAKPRPSEKPAAAARRRPVIRKIGPRRP